MLTRPTRLCVPLALALVTLGGCGGGHRSDVGPARSPEERRARFPISFEDYARLGYRQDWVGYPAVTGSLPVRHMAVYDDVVVTLEQGSTLTILETGTGGRRCAVQLSNPLTKFVGLAREPGGRLIAASDADVFFVEPQTCNLGGRQTIEKIAATEPVLVGNILVFGTSVGELLGHLTTAGGGVKAWGFATGAAIEHAPVRIGDTVGAVSQAGDVIFVNPMSGSLLGRERIFSGLATNPVADDDAMYVASLDQSVYAFSPSGSLLWRYRSGVPLRTQPTVHDGVLYVGMASEGLVAFEAASGRKIWTARGLENTVVVGMNRQGLVGFDAAAQTAYSVDAQRGDVLERVPVPGARIMRMDRFEGGNLYIVSDSGLVAKFQPR
jgi:hypothetical protein